MLKAEFELTNPPQDGITSTTFAPTHPHHLLATSWDSTATLYDIQEDNVLRRRDFGTPILDGCFVNPRTVLLGGLDKSVRLWDCEDDATMILGDHEAAVKCVRFSDETNLAVSGSWDKTMRLWDPRSSKPLVGTYDQGHKVFSMDMTGNMIVVGMSERQIHIHDVRKLDTPLQQRESSLKLSTRCVKCMPNGEGYVISSIEGRIAVEFFDPSEEIQAHKYAFKCHRQNIDGVDNIYPVNAIAFHPIHGTFASGGGDGAVNIWDWWSKKRIKQYSKYPTSIASMSFNSDGTLLAIASSYTFEQGELESNPGDSIFIRQVASNETKPKPRQ
ncbi:mitotic spindle checkpoint protein Bub3 [Basidiobolus ranarum]|uniref:Mitotic spindle checkpoint protein Bub3 n=1 Tax=Basidiobolus ranarum TaxID=34480 RepID=A0ABR2W0N2_9FUNG